MYWRFSACAAFDAAHASASRPIATLDIQCAMGLLIGLRPEPDIWPVGCARAAAWSGALFRSTGQRPRRRDHLGNQKPNARTLPSERPATSVSKSRLLLELREPRRPIFY